MKNDVKSLCRQRNAVRMKLVRRVDAQLLIFRVILWSVAEGEFRLPSRTFDTELAKNGPIFARTRMKVRWLDLFHGPALLDVLSVHAPDRDRKVKDRIIRTKEAPISCPQVGNDRSRVRCRAGDHDRFQAPYGDGRAVYLIELFLCHVNFAKAKLGYF